MQQGADAGDRQRAGPNDDATRRPDSDTLPIPANDQ